MLFDFLGLYTHYGDKILTWVYGSWFGVWGFRVLEFGLRVGGFGI